MSGSFMQRVPEEERSPQLAYYHRRKERLAREPAEVPSEKHCGRCKSAKPGGEFGRRASAPDGLQSWCSECQREYQRANRARSSERSRVFRKRHPERGAEYMRQIRRQALEHYSVTSSPSCACCGEDNAAFLVLDHIHGDGGKQRREVRGGQLYSWLRAHGYPYGMQVLCANCNHAKAYHGICPHQVNRQVPLSVS